MAIPFAQEIDMQGFDILNPGNIGPLSGNLDMGGNDIVNVDDVGGVKMNNVVLLNAAGTQTIVDPLVIDVEGGTTTLFTVSGDPAGGSAYIAQFDDGTNTVLSVDQGAVGINQDATAGIGLDIVPDSIASVGIQATGLAGQVADIARFAPETGESIVVKGDGDVEVGHALRLTGISDSDPAMRIERGASPTNAGLQYVEGTTHRIEISESGVFRWGGTTTNGSAYPSYLGTFGEAWFQGFNPAGFSTAFLPTLSAHHTMVLVGDDTQYGTNMVFSSDVFTLSRTFEVEGYQGEVRLRARKTDHTVLKITGHSTQTNPLVRVEKNDTTAVLFLNESGLKLELGATVNEFSTDVGLAGSSDTALPTENAVKVYVDGKTWDHGTDLTGKLDDDHTQYIIDQPGSAERNKITPSGDAFHGLVLTGTSRGSSVEILLVEDQAGENTYFAVNEGDINVRFGTTINEFSTDGTLAGDSDDALPTEKAVKTYVDNQGPSWVVPATKTGNFTAVLGEFIRVDTSSGNVTASLPTAVGNAGRSVQIVKVTSDSNKVIIDPFGSQTINGSTTQDLLVQWGTVRLVSDGANWIVG